MKKRLIIPIIIGIIIVALVAYFLSNGDETFTVDNLLIKSAIKESERTTQVVTVTSIIGSEYTLNLQGLEGVAGLDQYAFALSQGDTKELTLTFDASAYGPGIYIGYLEITTETQTETIPIILEVHSRDVFFATNLEISSHYKEIAPGDSFSPSIRVYNLKDTEQHTLEMNYIIKDLDSNSIYSEVENLIIGTDSTVSKIIYLPEELPEEDYVFIVTTESDTSYSTSTYYFTVTKEAKQFFSGIESFTFIFATAIVILLFAIVVLMFHTLKDRNELFRQLDQLQRAQLSGTIRKIEKKEKTILSKAKTKKTKEKILKEYKTLIKKEKGIIKRKQKKQKEEFKKLGSKDDMKKKLSQWKNQGFNLNIFKKVKKNKNSKKDKLKKWKKQGYDTSILK
ncbi:hypothetical protein HOD38_02795 [archaeon]|jgi:hypothetical protein|nr:hypothetical protein [archaeon]MBT4397169.1 hypothetical protein [archaeon]MBT4441525.1 hypothetical protein [archaeon]